MIFNIQSTLAVTKQLTELSHGCLFLRVVGDLLNGVNALVNYVFTTNVYQRSLQHVAGGGVAGLLNPLV